ncbi:hypothetical protein N7456_007306 [Penicillium angulare]|uniref:Uncharacterized protein n=1 Tax=Penicillium angulare TaxID=116970 RepID=A0A9W9K8A5_9EURO|nr:hypothetical protein N7456_007306 [Penicillium angulare]
MSNIFRRLADLLDEGGQRPRTRSESHRARGITRMTELLGIWNQAEPNDEDTLLAITSFLRATNTRATQIPATATPVDGGLSPDEDDNGLWTMPIVPPLTDVNLDFGQSGQFEGRIGGGVIVIDNIDFCYDLSLLEAHIGFTLTSLYRNTTQSAINTLRHLFFTGIDDRVTEPYQCLMTLGEEGRCGFNHDSRWFNELMGTQIGRIINRIVAFAFPGGTHRITRMMCSDPQMSGCWDIRFDIGPAA